MKKTAFVTLILFFFVHLSAKYQLTIHNKSQLNLDDAPVVIDLDKLRNYQGEKLMVLIANKEVPSQMDDLDRDGKLDELAFITDIQAGDKLTILLEKKVPSSYKAEVYTSLIKKNEDGTMQQVDSASSDKNDMYNKMHHHGVAFESDKIAYRIYFDNKSTIDIYGKKRHGFELKENNWYPTDEQLKQGYGDDILLVSGWVGNGTVKAWNGIKATHLDKFTKRTHRIIAKGPVRAIVQSELKAWEYEGKKVDLIVRYTLYEKHRDVIADVISSDPLTQLATGVQQIGGGELYQTDELLGSWGSWYPQPDTLKYKKETVGLGLYLPRVGRQKLDGVNNLILFPVNNQQRFYFTTIAAKEEQQAIQDAQSFFEYLKLWKTGLEAIQIIY